MGNSDRVLNSMFFEGKRTFYSLSKDSDSLPLDLEFLEAALMNVPYTQANSRNFLSKPGTERGAFLGRVARLPRSWSGNVGNVLLNIPILEREKKMQRLSATTRNRHTRDIEEGVGLIDTAW